MSHTVSPKFGAVQFAGEVTPMIRQALHVSETRGELSDAVRVRLDASLVKRLDRIEALARGAGMRDVTRSTLIRSALEVYVETLENELSLSPASAQTSPPLRDG